MATGIAAIAIVWGLNRTAPYSGGALGSAIRVVETIVVGGLINVLAD